MPLTVLCKFQAIIKRNIYIPSRYIYILCMCVYTYIFYFLLISHFLYPSLIHLWCSVINYNVCWRKSRKAPTKGKYTMYIHIYEKKVYECVVNIKYLWLIRWTAFFYMLACVQKICLFYSEFRLGNITCLTFQLRMLTFY